MHEAAAIKMLVAISKLLNGSGYMDESESFYIETRELPTWEKLARFRVLLLDLGFEINTDLLV